MLATHWAARIGILTLAHVMGTVPIVSVMAMAPVIQVDLDLSVTQVGLLVSGYYMLSQPQVFQDLGESYFDRRNVDSQTRYHIRRLEKLGHKVTVEPAA